jgi:hypothetical protein
MVSSRFTVGWEEDAGFCGRRRFIASAPPDEQVRYRQPEDDMPGAECGTERELQEQSIEQDTHGGFLRLTADDYRPVSVANRLPDT